MFFDLPLEELKKYCPERNEPKDFDSFWEDTISETKKFSLNPQFQEINAGLKLIRTYDVTFSGFNGINFFKKFFISFTHLCRKTI